MKMILKLLTLSAFSFAFSVNAENAELNLSSIENEIEIVHVFDSDVVEVKYVSGVVVTTESEFSTFKDGTESFLSSDGNCYKTTRELLDMKKNEVRDFYTVRSKMRTVMIDCPSNIKL